MIQAHFLLALLLHGQGHTYSTEEHASELGNTSMVAHTSRSWPRSENHMIANEAQQYNAHPSPSGLSYGMNACLEGSKDGLSPINRYRPMPQLHSPTGHPYTSPTHPQPHHSDNTDKEKAIQLPPLELLTLELFNKHASYGT